MAQSWPWGSQIAVKKNKQTTHIHNRPGKRKERKNKNTGNERINKKISYACDSDSHEIKDCDSGKNIFIIDRASKQINKEELKYRLE